MRSCDRYREALSARLDGEDPGMSDEQIDSHVDACDECRVWADTAGALTERMTGGGGPALRASALADLIDEAGPAGQRRRSLSEWRAALAIVGVVQLIVAWPGAFLDDAHTTAHAANELTSWDLGLAVGFLLLAWLPSRAWGALPVVAVMVALLTWTSASDLVAGQAEFSREAVHALQIAGLLCAWMLSRRMSRSSVTLRITSAT